MLVIEENLFHIFISFNGMFIMSGFVGRSVRRSMLFRNSCEQYEM